MDVSIGGKPVGRMVFEVHFELSCGVPYHATFANRVSAWQLATDIVPRTADNFRALCTGIFILCYDHVFEHRSEFIARRRQVNSALARHQKNLCTSRTLPFIASLPSRGWSLI